MQKKGYFIFVLLVAIFVSIFAPLPNSACANDSSIYMQAKVGFNGKFVSNKWVPIVVEMENNASDINALLEADAVQQDKSIVTFSTEAIVPRGLKKKITLYIRIPATQRSVDIRLVQDGNVLKKISLKNLSPMPEDEYLMGLLTENKDALGYLWNKASGDNIFAHHEACAMDAETFPSKKEVLDNFRILIINDFDTSVLSQEQIDALTGWLQTGGILIVGTGPNGKKTLNGLQGKALSADMGQREISLNLSALNEAAGIKSEGSYPVQLMDVKLSGGKQILGNSSVCFISGQQMGIGHVFLAAFDLGLEPIKSWAGNQMIWDNVLKTNLDAQAFAALINPASVNANNEILEQNILHALLNIKAVNMPSIKGLMILLLVYFIVVGPINYIILKRFDKREWLWLTVPLLVITFSSITYAMGYASKGSDFMTNTVSLVNIGKDGQAIGINNYTAVFIPRKGDYTVKLGKDVLFSFPVSSEANGYGTSANTSEQPKVKAKFVQGQQAYAQLYDLSIWDVKGFCYESLAIKGSGLKADIHTEDGKLSGTIANNFPYALEDLVLFTPYSYQIIGDIAPGQSKNISMQAAISSSIKNNALNEMLDKLYPLQNFNASVNGLTDEQRTMELRRGIMQDIIILPSYMKWSSNVSDAHFLQAFAFSSQNPASDIMVNDRKSPSAYGTSIIIGDLDVNFEKNGYIYVPPGFISATINDIKSDNVSFSPDCITLENSNAVFDLDISQFKDTNIDKLRIRVPLIDDNKAPFVTLAVYDPQTDTYIDSADGLSVDKALLVITMDGSAVKRFIKNNGFIELAVNTSAPVEIKPPTVEIKGRKR